MLGPSRLVHAAGITGAGTVTDEDPATWRRILEVNLTSAYLVTRAAIPLMRAAGGGAIARLASVNARFGGSALSGRHTRHRRAVWSRWRGSWPASMPSTASPSTGSALPGPHATPMWDALDEARRERILSTIPGGTGPGDPADLAALIAHLCSPAARYINGSTVDVNGGQWMG